ncbi:heparan-alpha-glucosaminide N-acetyltransferase-like [Pectinophora gossypiella]|uniref:heparan-alpha-glucosaminide N-acetyltransferase-like n=1 Tax=Pectinophora gossypiella TaxID=13191 RepID=UPI00214F1EC8|nr:heparan-alpha-glucosaminide N-acetyltransferase-like [Pectinophora gossypiella]
MSLGKFENVGAFVRDCRNGTLLYDEACLEVITSETVTFWSQYEECEGCKLVLTKTLETTGEIVLKTLSPVHYAVKNGNGQICNGTYLFGEFGQYTLNLTEATKEECLPRMKAEPDAAHLPILTAVVVLLAMATLWYIVKGIGKRLLTHSFVANYFNREDNELGSETRVLTAEVSAPRAPTRSRLRSLDIFRGFCIALMIFVNAGGGGYAIFSHSTWNGITVADVVFPWFAFAMGEALVLSLNARLRTSLPRTTAFYQVARRALLLAIIGIILGAVNVSWAHVRLPGVLQRLAAMYLVVGALECVFMPTSQNITPGRSLFRDIAAGWRQWLATIVLVTVQVCVTMLVAAPNCPRGYVGPGGLHMSAYGQDLRGCTGGIAGYIDRVVLGASHLYKRGSFRSLYAATVAFDPEGLLGILSGVLVVQAGAHATRIMLAYNHARARIMRWVFWSIIFGVTGGALCLFSKNGGPIPINKNLWSLSYCLVTSSMALFIQAVLYFIVDLKNKWGGRPLYYAGQNALFLYIGSELLKKHFPFYYSVPAPTHAQLLATHAATMLLWLAVGVALYKRRIFITL